MKITEQTQGLIFMEVFHEAKKAVPVKLHFEMTCLLMHPNFPEALQKFINDNNFYFDNAAKMINKLQNPTNYEYKRD